MGLLSALVVGVDTQSRAADASEERPRGKLIFSNGTFQSFDLETGKSETLLNAPYLWPALSWISPGKLLMSTGGGQIEEVDLATRNQRPIGRGYGAYYIPQTQQVLHLRALGKTRPALFVGDFARLDESAHRIGNEEHNRYFQACLLPGPTAVYASTGPETGAWRYDFRADSLERIVALSGWMPFAWRSATGQLVCGRVHGDRLEFILANASGTEQEPIEGLQRGIPVLYVPEYDGCIVNLPVNRLFAERSTDLCWFSFKHRKLVRLKEDMQLLPGTVVYTPPAG